MKSEGAFDIERPVKSYYPGSWLLVAMLVFFVVASGLFGQSPDWQNYLEIFDQFRISGVEAGEYDRTEFGFRLFAVLLMGLALSNTAVYAVIASTSVFIKCAAMNAVASSRKAFVFSVIFYLFAFASLHELTQLRAALAIALLFVGFVCLLDKKPLLAFLVALLAVAFHYSTIVVLPLFLLIYFFNNNLVTLTRLRVILTGVAVFAASVTLIALVIAYFEEELPIVAAYQEYGFGDVSTDAFAPHILLNLAMVAVGLLLWDRLTACMRYVLFIQCAGIGVFYATLDFQVVASRVYDLAQTFWVFYVAAGADRDDFLVRMSTQGFVVVSAAAYSYIYFFSGNFFS